DASELVEVDYEPLPAVVDARKALDPDAPVLHDDAEGNLMWTGLYSWGDLDSAFVEADRVVKIHQLRFVTQDIGRGFGNKLTSQPQLVVCCLLARKLNRPVQWTEWRTDFHLS